MSPGKGECVTLIHQTTSSDACLRVFVFTGVETKAPIVKTLPVPPTIVNW